MNDASLRLSYSGPNQTASFQEKGPQALRDNGRLNRIMEHFRAGPRPERPVEHHRPGHAR